MSNLTLRQAEILAFILKCFRDGDGPGEASAGG